MNLTLNTYAGVLLVSGLFTSVLAIFLLRKKGGVSRWFSLNMICTAWWAVTYSFELSSSTLQDILFWVHLEYIGITMLPLTWVAFIAHFTGKEQWLSRRNLALLSFVPLLTLLIVLTNRLHHLHYTSVSVNVVDGFTLLNLHPGVWYHFFTVYFYLNLAAGSYVLHTSFKNQNRIYRRQKNIILVVAIIPWVTNLIYILGFRPHHLIDLTPYAFTTSAVLVCLGLLRFSLFDIIPVAREKIVEAFRDGVLVLDIHHRVIDVNGRMKQILSWESSKKLIGLKLRELLPHNKGLQTVIADRGFAKMELEGQIDNEVRIFEVEVTPLFGKNNIYSGSIILFRDITARKKADQKLSEQSDELKDLNKLKDRLFSIIAHDLRAPIMNLKLLVNMIDTGMITDEEFKAFLPQLQNTLGYTSGLLENLLNWSKTQLEGQKIELAVFDLNVIAENEIKYCTTKASEKGITIIDRIAPETWVFADANMIELVIRNLLTNAIKFSKNGDEITVFSNYNSESEIMVCVKDTGKGLDPQQLQKLFLQNTFTTKGTNNEQGTGLGLLLCKDFVDKNNGKIWAESEEGSGTSIFFTLPVKKAPAKFDVQLAG